MAYATREARQHLLDTIGEAVDELAIAVAALGGAYDVLDEVTGDRLEDALFRPVQSALGRAKRTCAAFAERHGLETRDYDAANAGVMPSAGPRAFVERAAETIAEADLILSELQDSMMPVEVGDPEVRAGISDVRGALGPLAEAATSFLRTLGR